MYVHNVHSRINRYTHSNDSPNTIYIWGLCHSCDEGHWCKAADYPFCSFKFVLHLDLPWHVYQGSHRWICFPFESPCLFVFCFFFLFIYFSDCLLYPMLSVSLDCPIVSIPRIPSLKRIHWVCFPFENPCLFFALVFFSFIYFSDCVFCTQCCQCLWIVLS